MADMKKVEQVVQDIKEIKIQWATNIAKAAFQILIDELDRQKFATISEVQEFLLPAMDFLEKARPTEPMMFNGMAYIKDQIKNTEVSLADFLHNASEASKCYLGMVTDTAKKAIANGVWLLNYGDSVLTHCHSSSAIKTIIANKSGGKDFLVYNTETRPLYQGHKTAKDFLDAGMKITMVVDSSAPFILDPHNPFGLSINAVIIGCDAIKLNGDVINKVGSYSIVHAAYDNKIPVYIAGNLLKTDVRDSIQIETRSWSEIREDRPEGIDIINFAFDQVPERYITGIITEFGVIKPSEVREVVKKEYPWMK